MSGLNKVVVTGMGVRTPIGNTPDELKAGLLSNRSGVKHMPEWDEIQNLRTRVAGVCDCVYNEKEIPRRMSRSMGRVALLAQSAAADAIKQAGLEERDVASPDCGVSFGSTAGSFEETRKFLRQVFVTQSLKGLKASSYLKFMSHTCAANLAVCFGMQGPVIASCTACVAGSQGIGFGYEAIRLGRAKIMLTGGAEEMHYLDAGVFDVMRATSTRFNNEPHLTPRPFDSRRDGLVVGEGAGCLVLEEEEHAKKRGAEILAVVMGYGTCASGTHLTNSDVNGIMRAMEAAMKDALVSREDIDYINAHATATAIGDAAEAEATNRLFGTSVPVSCLKGYMGHTLGASGGIDGVATIIMLNDGFIAHTRNLEEPDPRIADLDHVMKEPREEKLQVAMSNNFAFGGINTSLIFARG